MPAKHAVAQDFPAEIQALAQKPLDSPIKPAEAVEGKTLLSVAGSSLEKRIMLMERALENFDLANLDSVDIATAERLGNLFKELELLKKKKEELRLDTEAKIRQLQVLEQKIAGELAAQRACEVGRGHRRDDNKSAIGGVIVDGHGFVGTCQKCGKPFKGIGHEQGQVPIHLWSEIDQETIGRA